MAFSFFGGVHPKENKIAGDMAIQEFPEPDILVIPMSQHIGAPCLPLVKKGDLLLSVRRSVTIRACAFPCMLPFPARSRLWKQEHTPAVQPL